MKLIIIGRDPNEANIILSSQYVSGYHAEIIQLDNGDMYLVDKSSNGTTVNGLRVTPGKEVPIHRGDAITFADTPLDWTRIQDVTIPSDIKKIISVGSHYMNDLTVDGNNVSRFHATIRQMADGKWFICDHSKNGTTVNGKRIPKDKYVKFTASDEISCAGIPVQNPIPSGAKVGKIIGIIAAAACVCALLVFGGIKLFKGTGSLKKYTVAELCTKYEKATVLMMCDYHFEVNCGTLKIGELPDPDSYNSKTGRFGRPLYNEFVIVNGSYIEKYEGDNGITYMGTGFFIGTEGNIATNRHIAEPWRSQMISFSSGDVTVIEAAEDYFKAKLNKLYQMGYTEALQYISQVKVSGELDHTIIIPNGDYLDEKNSLNCHVVAIAEDKDDDLAIFRIRSSSFPTEATYVPLDKINTITPEVGLHVVTMGFPLSNYLLDGKTQIQANVTEGSISRNNNPKTFGFSAPASHGASGSPVFDDHANLMGILWGGIDEAQGFTQAVRTECLVNLINKAGITK